MCKGIPTSKGVEEEMRRNETLMTSKVRDTHDDCDVYRRLRECIHVGQPTSAQLLAVRRI